MKNILNAWHQSLSMFWVARNAREQTMLSLAASVITLGFLYALLIHPALTGRTQLAAKLPGLHQQMAELQVLSQQATALSANTTTPMATLTQESLEASLTRKGLKSQSVVLTGNFVKLQFAAVSFAGLLDWLDEMQKTARFSVMEANINGLAQVDRVSATLTLQQQKNE